MNMASPIKDTEQKENDSSPKQNSGHKYRKLKLAGIDDGTTALMTVAQNNLDSGKLITPADNEENVRSMHGNIDIKPGIVKNSSKSAGKGKKAHPKLRSRRYPSRSSLGGARVLRSRSKENCLAPIESVSAPVNPVTETKKKSRKTREKKPLKDEFSKTRRSVRYLLTRMNYAQNFIDAYSGEGWKGQNLEKIKPEKELERAKSEILRRKLKIRDIFQHLDSSLSEGTLQESLFDSEGEIDSDDIFCAKCGSKNLSADNDIILCDGACNRGFHQKCLNPPLLSEDVPPGDEGWLCPACDCKVDCIALLNEFQGSDLCIEDMWEKVFPEAAAILNGDKQSDLLDLPSDDSEDEEYNPDAPKVDVENEEEGSSSSESDFTCSSNDSDSRASNRDRHHDNLGLPSDDSEDDDFNPDEAESNVNNDKNSSSLDESDFTSDSDGFMDELSKPSDVTEASAPLLSPSDHLVEGSCLTDTKKTAMNLEALSVLDTGMNEADALPVSGKRQRERLDYKKLYDETYGITSSDSSDDDDWHSMSTPKKGKKDKVVEESRVLPKANTRTTVLRKSPRSSMGQLAEMEAGLVQQQAAQEVNENTPYRIGRKLNSTTVNYSEEQHSGSTTNDLAKHHTDSHEPGSNGNKGTFVRRSLRKIATQNVFPEAAAILNGDKQSDLLDLPSDDSEDEEYNPDAPKVDVENEEGSSSSESDFTCSSNDSDSRASNRDRHHDNLGLPSDDSEDDDFNPDKAESNVNNDKNSSSLDESDFTSDSDGFMDELSKPSDVTEASAPLLSPSDHLVEGSCLSDTKKTAIDLEAFSVLDTGMNEEDALPVSVKRQRERLDYKKLYDETYGKTSSDSSDDDDWHSMSTPKKGKKDKVGEESPVLSKANTRTTVIRKSSRSSMGKLADMEAGLVQPQAAQEMNENTPYKIGRKLNSTTANYSEKHHTDSHEPDSNENKGTTVRRSLGKIATQKLHKSFKENQFPKREAKERLAEEVGLSLRQVDKWFGNARHCARVAAKEAAVPSDPNGSSGNTGGKGAKPKEVVSAPKVSTARNTNVRAQPNKITANGDEVGRHQAIARELRKMRKSR